MSFLDDDRPLSPRELTQMLANRSVNPVGVNTTSEDQVPVSVRDKANNVDYLHASGSYSCSSLRHTATAARLGSPGSDSCYGSTGTSPPISPTFCMLDENAEKPLLWKGSHTGHAVRTGSPDGVRCGCHEEVDDKTTKKAVCKLVLASIIALLFMAGEVAGGYFANSLSIMTDAAHMLSDFAGFLISLFAIWVSRRPPSRGMSFGWYRAEVLGALVSVQFIWVLTGVLFYEAVLRVVHMDFEVDAKVMLITACAGVFVNVFMCMVLGHGHGHGHGGGEKKKRRTSGGANEKGEAEGRKERKKKKKKKKPSHSDNINVRAAFIHVIGDLIQSIGVVIAGYIIWFKPTWKIVDPICTFIFCVLVLISTFNILKDALRVVMEGTPKHIDYEEVKADLKRVKGVKQAHSLHIWSITLNRTALAAHLALSVLREPGANSDEVLARASEMLKSDHQITQTTLQVEGYHNLMDDCGTCQEPERSGVLESLLPNFICRKL